MEITYDTNKNAINIAKHGVPLGDARLLEWNLLLVEQDRRHNYGEIRMLGFAPIGARVYCIVYTDRGSTRRIISLRKANRREVKCYADKI